MWKAYNCVQIFHVVAQRYEGLLLVPTLFSCSAGITISSYVCIRERRLPWLLYSVFLATSVSLFILTFWYSYELVTTMRSSEEVVQVLTSVAEMHSKELTAVERKYLCRKARATRPLSYRMGDVGKFSFAAIVVMWEEIWSQLLLLLSL